MWWKREILIPTSIVRAVALSFAVSMASLPLAAVEVGATFPALSNYTFDGGALPSDLKGKVLVVDFWASWCAPCKASFPTLSAVQNEFGSQGFQVIGVSVDEKTAAYEQFKKRLNPTFATVRDREHRLAADANPPTMPTTFVLDRAGRVRFVHTGFHDETPALLRRQIQQLLEEKS